MEISFSVVYGEGNEIFVSLSSFSDEALSDLTAITGSVDLVDISLARKSGNLYADWTTLTSITARIAIILKENPDIILYYYCDEISPIPYMRPTRNIKPAEYRNRLFSILTRKTIAGFPGLPVVDTPIMIETENGCAYIHLIYLAHMKQKADAIVSYLIDLAEGLK